MGKYATIHIRKYTVYLLHMHLIFARHGETDYNKDHAFQGLLNAPLNETGFSQAARLAKFCSGSIIKRIISSPLTRALQTAKAVGQEMGLNVELEKDLVEICYGSWEGVKKSDIDDAVLREREDRIFTYLHPGYYDGIPGESYEMKLARLVPLFSFLSKQSEQTLIVSHGGIFRCATIYFGGGSYTDAGLFRVPNDSVYIVTKQSAKFRTESVIVS